MKSSTIVMDGKTRVLRDRIKSVKVNPQLSINKLIFPSNLNNSYIPEYQKNYWSHEISRRRQSKKSPRSCLEDSSFDSTAPAGMQTLTSWKINLFFLLHYCIAGI